MIPLESQTVIEAGISLAQSGTSTGTGEAINKKQ